MGTERERMTRRMERRLAQDDLPWTPLERVFTAAGKSEMFDGAHWFQIWKNSRYTVMIRTVGEADENGPGMIHLSIKRNDKGAIFKWRDIQKIKNELVGPECEGLQLFPAESRLVDNANQYHLFVCAEPGFQLPFGYAERLVSEGNFGGAVQEPFEPHVRPPDIIPEDVMRKRYDEAKKQLGMRSHSDGSQSQEGRP